MSTAQVNNVVGFGGYAGGLSARGDSNIIIPNPANGNAIFSLYAGSTGVQVSPFMKNGVAYQVPAGKSFFVLAAIITGTSAGDRSQLVTSTVGFAQGGSLTGPIYQTGVSACYAYFCSQANYPGNYFASFTFPQNVFPGGQFSAAASALTVIGYEA